MIINFCIPDFPAVFPKLLYARSRVFAESIMMLQIAVISFVAGEDLVQTRGAFTALLLKAAQVGLSSAVTAQAGLGLSLPLLPMGCAKGSQIKPWDCQLSKRLQKPVASISAV